MDSKTKKIIYSLLAMVLLCLVIQASVWIINWKIDKDYYVSNCYEFRFVNDTSNKIHLITIYYDGKAIAESSGDFSRGFGSTWGGVSTPVPRECEVRWMDETDTEYSQIVKLSGIVPRRNDLEIYVIIHEDKTITIQTLRKDDIHGSMELKRKIKQNLSASEKQALESPKEN